MVPPRIRITEIRVHQLACKLKERFGWSLNWTHERYATLVEVRTDAGLTGWGDGGFGGETLIRNPGLVIGRSPFEAEAIFEDLRPAGGFQQRSQPCTAGGLDVALWDLMGQALDEPVHRLLGKQHRTRVEPYCTALYRKDWSDLATALSEEAQYWQQQGYRVIKMKIGYGPEVDRKIVDAVRKALGDHTGLAVDANCAYDAGTASMLGKQLEAYNLLWWEEPILANDYRGYARLRSAFSIPLASGESMSADELTEHYVQPRRVDILQPDIENVGLTGGRRLTYLTWLNHLRLIPHNWGTALRTVSELHWVSTVPPITAGLHAPPAMFEFDRTESPMRDEVLEEKIDIGKDGLIPVPDGSGLGVHVIPEAVAANRTRLIEIR